MACRMVLTVVSMKKGSRCLAASFSSPGCLFSCGINPKTVAMLVPISDA